MCLQVEANNIIKCLQFGRKSNEYSDEVRIFAFTLHYYSPRAFNYVREKFGSHLPDISTIRRWVSNCTNEGGPGISVQGIGYIKCISEQMKAENRQFYCSLAWDEMSIRRHILWSEAKKKFEGFITYGRANGNGDLPVASQALVFLITGVGPNGNTSIPIAHFFIKGLLGKEKANLITQIIHEVTKAGAKIVNVTFDGFENNFTACRLLGASFNRFNVRPFFTNTIDASPVFVICDNCHLLKLVRNFLGSEKLIVDGNGGRIEWKYFERLENCRVDKQFVTHNLTKKHIQWHKNKMNVRLAAQLFSNSVANALDYLKNHQHDGFRDCGPTIQFVRIINTLFDIFNTKHLHANNIFKSPLTKNTAPEIFDFLAYAEKYIISLKVGGISVLQCRKKKGIISENMFNVLCR